MDKILFTSFNSWKTSMIEGIRKTAFGITCIVTGTIFGIISLIAYAGKQINAFCRRETIAAAIIGVLLTILSTALIGVFVKERSGRVTAEYQRDSIAYKMKLYLQAYDTNGTIIVNGDTIIDLRKK